MTTFLNNIMHRRACASVTQVTSKKVAVKTIEAILDLLVFFGYCLIDLFSRSSK